MAFLVNDKMGVNIGDGRLMCRFDPEMTAELFGRTSFLPMIKKGKGYCYVEFAGFRNRKDFEF